MKNSQKVATNRPSERLLPAQRIREREVFKFIFENAVFYRTPLFKAWIYQDKTKRFAGAGPKLGIIVSRKTHASAVVRNLWKRRIRECFRKLQVKIKPKCLILIGSPAGPKKVPAVTEISAELYKLLAQTESLK